MEIKTQQNITPNKNEIKISDIGREQDFFDSNNKNNKDILKSIYGDEIFLMIDEISKFKDDSKSYMRNTDKELNIKYDYFRDETLKFINSSTNQIINAFHIDISNINEQNIKIVKGFVNEKMKLLNKVLSLYKQIREVINQNFLILKNFLQDFNLNQEYPLQEFFKKEFDNIINSWLFLKLDLEKFDFKKVIEESNLSLNYKDFLMKECHEKNSVMNIILPEVNPSSKNIPFKKEEYKDEINLLSDNSSHLVKLNITNVPKIEDFLSENKYDKLEILKINNSYISKKDIFKQFSSLNKLSIKYCSSFDINILNNLNQLHLKQLILDKNGFFDEDFDNLMMNMKSTELLNNLEILSFANNNISNIDFNKYLSSPKDNFNALNVLNVRNNDLFKIIIDINYFPKLNVIDCSNNNLTTNYFKDFEQYNKIIILQSGNFFLMDDDFCDEYYSDLKDKLININNFSLKNLSLSYIPTLYSSSFFEELNINNSLLINLKKLDLSYNGLSCDTLFSFLGKNKECLNLRTLNLIGNDIDDTFFEKYLNLGLNKIFSNLNKLYLNDNNIGNDTKINYKDEEPISKMECEQDIYKLRLIYRFISENKNLKKLTINKNPICNKYTIIYEIDDISKILDDNLVKDKNDKIIINDFYSFLLKIKNDLSDRKDLNIGFDCIQDLNLNSKNYPYDSYPIMFIS